MSLVLSDHYSVFLSFVIFAQSLEPFYLMSGKPCHKNVGLNPIFSLDR
jgi:hypothetical protein